MMSSKLEIRGYPLGDWQTNCYVIWPAGSSDCWIIDAGFDPEPLAALIRQMKLTPKLLALTHAHLDHIAGVNDLRRIWPGLPIAIHEAEARFLTDPVLNLSGLIGMDLTSPPADRLLRHGDVLMLGDLKFNVLHTPGHSPGGVCFYQPENHAAFVGDTLFNGSVGRSDFPTSDPEALIRSIRERLYTLPGQTQVFPGHGPATTIAREKKSNPFVKS